MSARPNLIVVGAGLILVSATTSCESRLQILFPYWVSWSAHVWKTVLDAVYERSRSAVPSPSPLSTSQPPQTRIWRDEALQKRRLQRSVIARNLGGGKEEQRRQQDSILVRCRGAFAIISLTSRSSLNVRIPAQQDKGRRSVVVGMHRAPLSRPADTHTRCDKIQERL